MKFVKFFKNYKQSGLIYSAIAASFVFGISCAFFYIQKDQTQLNITPIKLYNQSKQVQIDATCPIKGNASSMIYHLPGDSSYARLNATDCFENESAAQVAGFRKSAR